MMADDSAAPSISEWLLQFKLGDHEAAQRLWDRIFDRLVKHAEGRVARLPSRSSVEGEEVAVSVFESLWRGAQAGRFQKVANRDQLWWLILALTRRKVASHFRKEMTVKRGGRVSRKSLQDKDNDGLMLDEIATQDLSPEYSVMAEEEYSRLLALLRDDSLREVAVLRMEGFTIEEIGLRLEIDASAVSRKLTLIRATWARELE